MPLLSFLVVFHQQEPKKGVDMYKFQQMELFWPTIKSTKVSTNNGNGYKRQKNAVKAVKSRCSFRPKVFSGL